MTNLLHIGLKENTQILMADGSTKNIQDINYNDYIKSWDFQSKHYINSKVYMVVRNEMAYLWTRILFTDGTYLDVSNEHQICEPRLGTPTPFSKMEEGAYVLTLNGKKKQIAWIQENEEVEYTNQYSLLTEASVYFADGIMCGHQPYEKKRLFPLFMNNFLSDNDWEEAQLSANVYEHNLYVRKDNKPYYRQSADFFLKHALLSRQLNAFGDYSQLSEEERNSFIQIKGEKKAVTEQLMTVKKLTNTTEKKGQPRMFSEAQAAEVARIKERELRE